MRSSDMTTPAPNQTRQVSSSKGGRANSLGLDDAQVQQILDELDGSTTDKSKLRRVNTRLPFRSTTMVMIVEQPGGRSVLNVVCRNLSRGGVGFLHSSYLHVGAKCVAMLPHRTRGETPVAGTVVRCRHATRNIHDVGVKFNEAINVSDYVAIDHTAGMFSRELIDPAKISGRILVVVDYSIDRALLKHQLEATNLNVRYENSVQEAAAFVKANQIDLIVTDFDLGTSGSAADLITDIRAAGIKLPVIVLSADGSAATRQIVRDSKAEAFLIKPVPKADLLRAIVEFLPEPVEAAGPCAETSELGLEFSRGLAALADEMEASVTKSDVQGFLRTCNRVTATAASVGLVPVATTGEAASKAVMSSMSTQESTGPINAFLVACRRVTPAPPAAATPAAETPHAAKAA